MEIPEPGHGHHLADTRVAGIKAPSKCKPEELKALRW